MLVLTLTSNPPIITDITFTVLITKGFAVNLLMSKEGLESIC